MSQASKLRTALREPGMVIAPGAYDGLTAMLVAQAGFPAVYMTGAGTSVAHGYPDFGLLTATEMVANAARMARAVDIPVIADADTGYGNELNVVRTVRDYEQAGVAGIHIEDQASPKRCGHLDDKEIVPREDWIAKIRAAAATKKDPDFLIIARTDSRAVIGFEEAIGRANEALANGADMAFVEAPQTMEEVAAVPKLVKGPCLLNVVWGGKTPVFDLREAAAIGFKLAIVPALLLKAAIGACDDALTALKETHTHPAPRGGMTVRDAFNRVGAREWDVFRTRFRDGASWKAAE
ncbi:MAG: isocitrate lyase/PEP mutase family protein [Rhodopila sp.]|nr:isocitrate lyase/PEP mutase family protein [Rhodopila sp.]